jgi:predicted MPP superfamily phosphohydrolase
LRNRGTPQAVSLTGFETRTDLVSHSTFLFVLIGSTLIDAFVAGMGLFLPRSKREGQDPETIDLERVLSASLITVMVFLIIKVMLWSAGLNLFGVIHLAYADLTVLLPSAGIALLIASHRSKGGERVRLLTVPVRMVALVSLSLIPIGIYATWVEPFRLQLETARVAVSPRRDGEDPVRIGVLSDLQTDHVTDYERNAVAHLMALKPDLILLPGDVFQGGWENFEENRSALRDLLSQLSAPGGVYLVLGDVDGPGEHLREILGSTSVRLLVNDMVRVTVGDRLVTIGGVELNTTTVPARNLVHCLETSPGDDDIRILLTHRPDVALGLQPGSRIDLVVAGHTHGGQVVVPWFGPPITLSRVPRNVAAGGLHTLEGNNVYISRGVGFERGQAPRIRFLCPPEITLLSVETSNGEGKGRGAVAVSRGRGQL